MLFITKQKSHLTLDKPRRGFHTQARKKANKPHTLKIKSSPWLGFMRAHEKSAAFLTETIRSKSIQLRSPPACHILEKKRRTSAVSTTDGWLKLNSLHADVYLEESNVPRACTCIFTRAATKKKINLYAPCSF